MKPRTTFGALRAWLGLALAPLPLATAAQAPADGRTEPPTGAPPTREEIISLDVFEVRVDSDVGYVANSALAGGRIEAALKDTPSVVSVFTREFLDDVAALNAVDAAAWGTNSIPVTESAGFMGEHGVNIRGVGTSFPSRNYFRWYITGDNFNTERLELARGPNSILFGDGGLGGINTTWTKQANFNLRRSAELRLSSYGGYRASLDFNVPAGDRLAVRVNGLHDRLRGWRDYDTPSRDGVHIAATFRISRSTQVRGEFEQGHYRRYTFGQNFTDQSSNWNRLAAYNGVTAPSTTGTGVSRLNSGVNDDYLVFDPNQPQLGLANWKGFFQSTGTGLALLPDARAITNFPALPSREFSLQPPDAFIDATYKSWTFYVEQRLPADIIGQVALNRQVSFRTGNMRSWAVHRIDVNSVLPNGAPNPNFGQPFAEVVPQRQSMGNMLYDARVSFAHRKAWRWLRQSTSLFLGVRDDGFNSYAYTAGRVNGGNVNATAATNSVRIRQYWSSPRNPAGFDSLVSNGSDVRFLPTSGGDEDQKLWYNQLASATSLFQGKLSLLLGYRYDTHERKQHRNVAFNPDGSFIWGATKGPGTFDTSKLHVGTSSAGAVWFPVPWVGAFVNYSESFNAPGTGEPRIDSSPLPTSSNEGVDLGLKIEFFGGKLSGTISHYRSAQTDRPRGGDRAAEINEIWTALGRPEMAIAAYRDTDTYDGRGYELDLRANLTRGWRLMVNYALPETKQSDIGASLRGYYATHIAAWRAGASNPALPDAARIAQRILDIESTISGYTQGRALNGTLKYTANAYSTYAFREGRLKGIAFGLGANFRGKQVIGNLRNQPFAYLYADPFALVAGHVSYERKFGRIRARFQLNVANVLDEKDLVFTGYTFNAAMGRDIPNAFRFPSPRQYSLTTNFQF